MKLSRLKQIIKETLKDLNERKNISGKSFLCCCDTGEFTCEGFNGNCGGPTGCCAPGYEVGCDAKGEFHR
jgi:hypothetical protein